MLHIFEISGFGNYSESFSWDTGLSCSISSISKTKAFANCEGLGFELKEGVYYNLNEHGGSRLVWGYVVAPTKTQALELVKKLEESYPVKEYAG